MIGDSFDDKSSKTHAAGAAGFSLFRPGKPMQYPSVAPKRKSKNDVSNAALMPLNAIPDRIWDSISTVGLDSELLARNGLFVDSQQTPATSAFDMLRTRLLQAMDQREWRRIAITSPTHGCGKSFVAANLALSLARMANVRTVLMDLELRNPGLADLLGLKGIGPLQEFLSGEQPLESHFRRVGRNLALALNGVPVAGSAELLHDTVSGESLDTMIEYLDPTIVLYDLPPALGSDDVMMMMPQIDAVLLIADGTRTSAEDVRACEKLFEGRIPLMGVVLNKAQDRAQDRYRYGKN